MALATKPFRIEQILGDALPPAAANQQAAMSGEQHKEIMSELAALRRLIEPSQEINQGLLDNYRQELTEAMKLKKDQVVGAQCRRLILRVTSWAQGLRRMSRSVRISLRMNLFGIIRGSICLIWGR